MLVDQAEEVAGGESGGAPEAPEIVEKKPLTVDLTAAEEDDDEPAPREERTREPKRHRSDWRKMKEAHEAQIAEMRAKLAELTGQLGAIRERTAHAPPPPAEKPDPAKQEIRAVRDQQQALLGMISAAQTVEEQRRLTEQYHDLDEKRIALISESRTPKKDREQPEITPDTVSYMTLAGEYPEIYDDPDLRLEAQVEMAKLMRKHHKPRSIATAREACQRVMAANGLGRKIPAPTDTERSRYSSMPARGGTASNGAASAYQPSKYQLSMARAYTAHLPDLSDQERFVHWVRATKAKENGLL